MAAIDLSKSSSSKSNCPWTSTSLEVRRRLLGGSSARIVWQAGELPGDDSPDSSSNSDSLSIKLMSMVSFDSRYVDNIDPSGTVSSVKAVRGM